MINSCTLNDIKMLYVRFATAYGYKFTSNHTTPEIIELWYQEWRESLAGIERELVFQAFNECKITLDWPPTIAEMIKYCDKHLGIPNIYEALKLAATNNFDCPLVKKLYEKIGSWDFKNSSEKVLLSKAKLYLPEILTNFRSERKIKALALENKPRAISVSEIDYSKKEFINEQ